jgi:hypothetical protein
MHFRSYPRLFAAPVGVLVNEWGEYGPYLPFV